MNRHRKRPHALVLLFCLLAPPAADAQSLQLHYDFRHSLDAGRNPKNYPSIVFEQWKAQDFGSFDFKAQADLSGAQGNIGQVYVQVQQSLRLGKSNFSVFTQYAGGLGVVDPGLYGYHISNALALGGSYLCFWQGVWFSFSLTYEHFFFEAPSNDLLATVYWGTTFLGEQVAFNGDFEVWTQNRNHGDGVTPAAAGKTLLFYGEPQLWYNLTANFSLGSKVNFYYHILTQENRLQVYPTLAVSYKF